MQVNFKQAFKKKKVDEVAGACRGLGGGDATLAKRGETEEKKSSAGSNYYCYYCVCFFFPQILM